METDVLIIGGGLAGLSAAYEVARLGVNVTIVEESWSLGGQLRQQTDQMKSLPPPFNGECGYTLAGLLEERLCPFHVNCLLNHTAIGIDREGRVGISNHKELIHVTASTVVVATGAEENPITFMGWTLPGVITIGAAQILINRERVYPGKLAIVVGSSDFAIQVVRQMHQVGINICGVVERAESLSAKDSRSYEVLRKLNVPVYLQTEITEVIGKGRVEKAFLVSYGHKVSDKTVDIVCVDGGRRPILEALSMFGCDFAHREPLGGWVPIYDRDFATNVENVYVAGDVAGVTCSGGGFVSGAIAGISVAERLGALSREEAREKKDRLWEQLYQIESEWVPEVWQARLLHTLSVNTPKC